MNVNDRVKIIGHSFLGEGFIKRKISGVDMYVVKLDEKAPNTYAWDTDEVLMFNYDLEVI